MLNPFFLSPTLPPLVVEEIPGGFTVVEDGNDGRWWSVAYRGTTPTIASHLCESVDPDSRIGRHILAAIREERAAAHGR